MRIATNERRQARKEGKPWHEASFYPLVEGESHPLGLFAGLAHGCYEAYGHLVGGMDSALFHLTIWDEVRNHTHLRHAVEELEGLIPDERGNEEDWDLLYLYQFLKTVSELVDR